MKFFICAPCALLFVTHWPICPECVRIAQPLIGDYGQPVELNSQRGQELIAELEPTAHLPRENFKGADWGRLRFLAPGTERAIIN